MWWLWRSAKASKLVPLVGPSSILLSLMASGFNGQSFVFRGYLPVEARARAAAFKEMERAIARNRQTQIFIETPYRNRRLLEELTSSLPATMLLCVAVDINGEHQNISTRQLQWWKANPPALEKRPAIFLLYS